MLCIISSYDITLHQVLMEEWRTLESGAPASERAPVPVSPEELHVPL